ncbi:MAG: site-2 protease family protein, partial [Clostridia bacterium]|nr:site-2 protease family protein [Clostridia bacterium]
MNILYILLALFIFSALVFIHELGHFLVARKCGVYILEFAIGMGPKLISKKSKKSGTVYSIRLFPIGGFVSMLGEDGMELAQGSAEPEKENPGQDEFLINSTEEPEEKEPQTMDPELAKHAYCNQSVWKRMLISLAGPAMNVILGFVLMFVMITAAGPNSVATTQVAGFHIAYTGEEETLGFKPGDYLYSFRVGNEEKRIRSMEQVMEMAGSLAQGTVDLYVQRYNADQTDVELVLIEDVPLTTSFVESHFISSLSERSGLRIGDQILKVNSTPVHTGHELSYEIMNQGHREMTLWVLRDGQKIPLQVTVATFNDSGATFGEMDFLIFAESDFNVGVILKHTWFRSCSTVKMVYD